MLEISKEQLSKLFMENMGVIGNLLKAYNVLTDVILHTKLNESGQLEYSEGWDSAKEEYENIIKNETFNDFLYQEVIDLAVDINKYKNCEELPRLEVSQVEKIFNKENKPKKESQIIELLKKYKDETDLSGDNTEEYENKRQAIKSEIEEIVKKLVVLYQPIFSGNRPFGIVVNDMVLQVMIDSGNRTYKLTTHKRGQNLAGLMDLASNIEKSYNNSFSIDAFNDENIDVTAKENRLFPNKAIILDALNKNTNGKILLSFPHFHLAMVTRRKGLWSVLTKNIQGDSLSEGQLTSFLTEYFEKLLIEIGDERSWWVNTRGVLRVNKESSTFNGDMQWLKSCLFRVCIIMEYNDGLNAKLRIACDKQRIEQEILPGQKDILPIEEKGYKDINTLEIYVDKNAYDKMPFFASNIMDKIKDEVVKRGFNVPIGRDYKGNLIIENFGGSKLESCINMLVAGSRSGKGVLTLTVSGVAVAKKYPIFYLDCKPDMAKTLYNITEKSFTIDGFGISGDKRIPRKINGMEVGEYAKTTSNDFLSFVENNLTGTATGKEYKVEKDENGNEKEIVEEVQLGSQYKSFIDLIAYTKGIELLNDIVDARSSSENVRGTGRDKYQQILFVVDELEQYTNRLKQMFFEKDPNRKMDDPNDKTKKIQLLGVIDKILEVNGGYKYKYYVDGIRRWIERTWRNFKDNSQSKIAQAGITLFMIFQHNDFASNEAWDDVVCPSLVYLSKGRMLLGRGTDSGAGSRNYGCQNASVQKALQEAGITAEEGTKQGHFVLRGDVTKAITTCFLVNDSVEAGKNTASGELKGVFGNLTTEPAVCSKLRETLFGDSNANEGTAPLLEEAKVVGFPHFAYELLNGENGTNESVADILAKGTECANYFTDPENGLAKDPVKRKSADIWENIYDFSPEAFGIKDIAQDKVGTTSDLSGFGDKDEENENTLDFSFIKRVAEFKMANSIILNDNIMRIYDEKNCFELSEDIVSYLEQNDSTSHKVYTNQLDGSATEKDTNTVLSMLKGVISYVKDIKIQNDKIDRANERAKTEEDMKENIEIGGSFNGVNEADKEVKLDIEDEEGELNGISGDQVIEGYGADNNDDTDEDDGEEEGEINGIPRPTRQGELSGIPSGMRPNVASKTTQGNVVNNMQVGKDKTYQLGNQANGLIEAVGNGVKLKNNNFNFMAKKFSLGKVDVSDIKKVEKNMTKEIFKQSGYKLNKIQLLVLNGECVAINGNKMYKEQNFGYGEDMCDLFDFKSPYFRELKNLRKIGMDDGYMWRYAQQMGIPTDTGSIAKSLFAQFKQLMKFITPDGEITRKDLIQGLKGMSFEADKDMAEKNVRNETSAELSNLYSDDTKVQKDFADYQKAEYKNISNAERKLIKPMGIVGNTLRFTLTIVSAPFRLVGWVGRRLFGI